LVAPCDGCGVAAACPASAEPAQGPRALRPLRHAEPFAAALAALRAVAAAWDRPPHAALEAELVSLVAERSGARAVPPPPFELSLKVVQGRLEPALRVVEYSATGPWRLERARLRLPALVARATRLMPDAPFADWLALVAAAQPPGLEVSLGLEARLDGAALRPQLYAHIDPCDRAAQLRLAEALVRWSSGASAPLAALFAAPFDRPVALVLVAHAPASGDPRRLKLYLSAPLAAAHASSGLTPAPLGALAAHAPPFGLAVLECGVAGVRWRKHDFPSATHFQRAAGLAADFARGLDAADGARLRRLLDGGAFAAWPTWLSVSDDARSLYFIPR
jgi:hypothetical protein